MNKMVRENIVTKLERGGGWGNERTWRPDGMEESEEACLTITTKRHKSLTEICFEVNGIAEQQFH